MLKFNYLSIGFVTLASIAVLAVTFAVGWYVGWRNRGSYEHKQVQIKKSRFL